MNPISFFGSPTMWWWASRMRFFLRLQPILSAALPSALYVIEDKPDVSKTPLPRFDLLKLGKYASMAVQFSRGCPFQCEFCDIITIYGRKPRTKPPASCWRNSMPYSSSDGASKSSLLTTTSSGTTNWRSNSSQALAEWQQSHGYPFLFYTEASIDLAQKPKLIEAMVKANFFYVFIGIESPSPESLTEAKKFQNLRQDPLESIRFIQKPGSLGDGGFHHWFRFGHRECL